MLIISFILSCGKTNETGILNVPEICVPAVIMKFIPSAL